MIDSRFADIRMCTTRQPGDVAYPAGIPVEQAISMNGKTWDVGETIGFGFLDGSSIQKKKAQRWLEYITETANLHFDFNARKPDVRITFMPGGSWSYIGTDCKTVRSGPTMQFGWVNDRSDEVSDRAVIVHEGIHMIGGGHEQSHPDMDINWNYPLATEYFMTTQGWSKEMVYSNVFALFDRSLITATAYERASIMQYAVDERLTLDHRGIGWNTDMTLMDKNFWSIVYPGVYTPIDPVDPVLPDEPDKPVFPEIVIGAKKPTAAKVPAISEPARFSLHVPRNMSLNLIVSVKPSYGIPLMRIGNESIITKLSVRNGSATYPFEKGDYVVGVWNPTPRQTGIAFVRARHTPD